MSSRTLLEATAQRAATYVESASERRIQPEVSVGDLRATLGGPLPQKGCDDQRVIDELIAGVEPGLLTSTSTRFFGWVIGGTQPAGLAADFMTSAWDQNAGAYACSPAAAVVEEIAGQWLKELLGLPSSSSFALVTGCQMAHVTALNAARYRLLHNAGWDVNRKGLLGGPAIRVLTGAHHHETFARALRLLGIGLDSIERLPLREGCLDKDALEAALAAGGPGPTLVCLQAGDLNTGHFDDFDALCDIAHARANTWVHVDGAFGLWASLSAEHEHLLKGVEKADSWATDGHKWLNVPYDCGYAFVADAEAHRACVSMDASYIIVAEDNGRDAIDWSPEWSRRARAFPTYAVIRALGKEGIGQMVARGCAVAKSLVVALGEIPGVEVVQHPIINQGLVRFLADDGQHDAWTDKVCTAIQKQGSAWFGATTWLGQRVMRISVCNHQTTLADVAPSVEAVRRAIELAANA